MAKATVYHYTHFSNVGEILGKVRMSGSQSGIEPRKPIHPLSKTKAISALLQPTPESWINNPHFPLTWKILRHDLSTGPLGYGDGELLLEIEVDSQRDEVYIAERAIIEAALSEDKTGIPQNYLYPHLEAATRAFDKSMVPLSEYLEEPQEYSLPLVVIPFHIPAERVIVSPHQPLLEENLKRLDEESRRFIITTITCGYAREELIPWRTGYEAQHGPIEILGRRKEAF